MSRQHWMVGLVVCLLLAGCGGSGGLDDNVLFRDDFSPGQGGNWHIEGDQLGRTALADGHLIIEIDAANTIQYVTLEDQTFADFTLVVDAQPLSGSPTSTYGVLIRQQGPNQFYRFEISGDGLFMIERRNGDGTWTRLVEKWTESSAITPGIGVANQLKITAAGPTLSFFVNGNLVSQATDFEYAAGQIALDAGTYGQPGWRVAFDNLVVSRP